MTCGVYKIINEVNGKIYIGSSKDLEKRWKSHKQQRKFLIGRALNKYGIDNFVFEVLEECVECDLLNREQYYLDSLKPFTPTGYNICVVAGNTLGVKWTDERRQQQSELRKALGFGKWNKGKVPHNKGISWSDDIKDKISAARLGKLTGSQNHKSIACSFISPGGEIVECESINGLARQNNLSPQGLWMVYKGQRNHHKGWRLNRLNSRTEEVKCLHITY